MASALALLQAALVLLTLVQSTPNLPQSVRDSAALVAQQAITEATRVMGGSQATVSSAGPQVSIQEPGNGAAIRIGSPIPIVWRVENAPQNSQVLLRMEAINTSSGMSGGTWQSQQLPIGGQHTQSYYWQTGSGYLSATGQYRLTAYLIACEPQGCTSNNDSQSGLGRTRYATSQPITINVAQHYADAGAAVPRVTLISAPTPSATTTNGNAIIDFSMEIGVENMGTNDIFVPLSSAMTSAVSGSAPAGAIFQIVDNAGNVVVPIAHVPSTLIRLGGGSQAGNIVRITPGQIATFRLSTTYTVASGSGRSYQMKLVSVGWSRSSISTPESVASALDFRTPSTHVLTGAAPTINSFTASPSQVTAGQSATLSWGATNTVNGGGCHVFANPGSSGTTITASGNWDFVGTHTVAPATTTTYTLKCFSSWTSGSPSATSVATVTVN